MKYGGAQLHTEAFHGQRGGKGWQFRCPRSFYSVAEDWNQINASTEPTASAGTEPAAHAQWDQSILDMFVINTNKEKGILNFLGMREGQLLGERASWADQKAWLSAQLADSRAAWKV